MQEGCGAPCCMQPPDLCTLQYESLPQGGGHQQGLQEPLVRRACSSEGGSSSPTTSGACPAECIASESPAPLLHIEGAKRVSRSAVRCLMTLKIPLIPRDHGLLRCCSLFL